MKNTIDLLTEELTTIDSIIKIKEQKGISDDEIQSQIVTLQPLFTGTITLNRNIRTKPQDVKLFQQILNASVEVAKNASLQDLIDLRNALLKEKK